MLYVLRCYGKFRIPRFHYCVFCGLTEYENKYQVIIFKCSNHRYRSWWGNRREGDHWGDLGVDGWIILGWISRRWDVGRWIGLGWPRIGTGGVRL